MNDTAEYKCRHCGCEDLRRHCQIDCGWGSCQKCGLPTDLSRAKEES